MTNGSYKPQRRRPAPPGPRRTEVGIRCTSSAPTSANRRAGRQLGLGAREAGGGGHRVDELGGQPVHVVPQVPVHLGSRAVRRRRSSRANQNEVVSRGAPRRPRPTPSGPARTGRRRRRRRGQRDPGQAVGPRGAHADRLRAHRPTSSSGPRPGPAGADRRIASVTCSPAHTRLIIATREAIPRIVWVAGSAPAAR